MQINVDLYDIMTLRTHAHYCNVICRYVFGRIKLLKTKQACLHQYLNLLANIRVRHVFLK